MSEINSYKKQFAKHISYSLDYFKDLDDRLVCVNNKRKDVVLTDYQKFTASNFLLDQFKTLLLFWETGFGKTIECVYIINNLFNVYPKWTIYLFVKSSLSEDPWKSTIDAYLSFDKKESIYMVNYDYSGIENLFILKRKSSDPLNRILYIFDEAHDFIKQIMPDDTDKDPRLSSLVNPIIKDINKGLNKCIFMSATPIHDKHNEFIYFMNFLRNGNISIKQQLFNKNKQLVYPELLSLSTLGLTSFKRRSNLDIFKDERPTELLAGKTIKITKLTMSYQQTEVYNETAYIESQSPARGFRILRKLTNTFALEYIKIKKSYTKAEYEKILKDSMKDFEKMMDRISFSKEFILSIKNNTLKCYSPILSSNLGLEENNNVALSTLEEDFEIKTTEKELDDLDLLHSISCKYVKTCQLVLQSPGKCLIYQPFVTFEGVKTLTKYLDKFNITYIEYTQRTKKNRSSLVDVFNHKNNINGDKIKCCVLSSAGVEGISFKNIRDMIIMDLPWSGSVLEQIFGRGIRLNSHEDLKLEQRMVNIHILLNKTANQKESVDYEMLDIIQKKEYQKQQLLQILSLSSLESLYSQYQNIEPVEIPEFYQLTHFVYNEKNYSKKNYFYKKKLLLITYSFDDKLLNFYEGLLDNEIGYVYNKTTKEHIGHLIYKDGKPLYKILNAKLIYVIKTI